MVFNFRTAAGDESAALNHAMLFGRSNQVINHTVAGGRGVVLAAALKNKHTIKKGADQLQVYVLRIGGRSFTIALSKNQEMDIFYAIQVRIFLLQSS